MGLGFGSGVSTISSGAKFITRLIFRCSRMLTRAAAALQRNKDGRIWLTPGYGDGLLMRWEETERRVLISVNVRRQRKIKSLGGDRQVSNPFRGL